jgi:hypothetical protein
LCNSSIPCLILISSHYRKPGRALIDTNPEKNGASLLWTRILLGDRNRCISPCPPVDPQLAAISRLDDYLIPLVKAVDVIADQLPASAKDDDIFKAAVERSGNIKQLEPFKDFRLKGRIQDGTGVILVCTKDEKEAIIEDVSCTTRPDTHRPSGSPCIYLLDVKAVCAGP